MLCVPGFLHDCLCWVGAVARVPGHWIGTPQRVPTQCLEVKAAWSPRPPCVLVFRVSSPSSVDGTRLLFLLFFCAGLVKKVRIFPAQASPATNRPHVAVAQDLGFPTQGSAGQEAPGSKRYGGAQVGQILVIAWAKPFRSPQGHFWIFAIFFVDF